MQEKSDVQLLRTFAEEGSESAFGELVARYTDLVYSAAIRQVGSTDLAKEVAQSVFIDLAKKARALSRRSGEHETIAGWLYRSARYASMTLLRNHRRQLEKERQAVEQQNQQSGDPYDWETVEPALDSALEDLSRGDREAILLRFFQKNDFRSVGLALGISDDAAQKKVTRAVEKLRQLLKRCGVTVSAAGLSAGLSSNAVLSAPAGLAVNLAGGALAGIAAGTSNSAFIYGVVAMTKLKTISLGVITATAVSVSIWQTNQLNQFKAENDQLRLKTGELSKLREENGELKKVVVDRAELERLRDSERILLGELAKVRGRVSESSRVALENARLKADLTNQLPKIPDAMTNAVAQGLATARKFHEQQLEQKIARMKERINLSETQAADVRTGLMRNIDLQSQMTFKSITGNLTDAERDRFLEEFKSPDTIVLDTLSPQQQVAYGEFRHEELVRTAQENSKSEIQQLRQSFKLTSEQEDQVFQIIYQANLDQAKQTDVHRDSLEKLRDPAAAIEMGTKVLAGQLERKLKALETVLSAEQLEEYRKQQMKTIDHMKMAGQMFQQRTATER